MKIDYMSQHESRIIATAPYIERSFFESVVHRMYVAMIAFAPFQKPRIIVVT